MGAPLPVRTAVGWIALFEKCAIKRWVQSGRTPQPLPGIAADPHQLVNCYLLAPSRKVLFSGIYLDATAMKRLRHIFITMGILVALAMGAAAVGFSFAIPRMAKRLQISYEVVKSTQPATVRLRNVHYCLAHLEAHADEVILLKPLHFFSQFFFHRFPTGHIQVQNLTVGIGIRDVDAKLFGGSGDGERQLLQFLENVIGALKSPILRHCDVGIRSIKFSNLPIRLENVKVHRGTVEFYLVDGGKNRILSFSTHFSSLRSTLRAIHRRLASGQKISHMPSHLLGGIFKNFTGSLELNDFPVSLLGYALPELLKPHGVINGNLLFRDGQSIGSLQVDGVQSRPIHSIGVIRELQARVQFEPNVVHVKDLQLQFQRGTLRIGGNILHEGWKNFRFFLDGSGSNVSLVQDSGLQVSGNVNCKLRTLRRGKRRTTSLSGTVELLPSLWYIEGVQSAAAFRQFSPKDALFPKDWVLDIQIGGERFLRINAPYFRGIISAQAAISGTAAVPIVYGQAVISEGSILFPFARFRIFRGTLTVDPTHLKPFWDVDAEARLHSYDLRLHLAGKGFAPIFNFSSTPSLSNGDIIAMITAGQLPDRRSIISGERNPFGALGAYFGTSIFGDDFADRMHLQVGQDLTKNGRETMELEYILDERHSILAEYDRYDNYGVDMRFKIYSH
ncbi:MAG: translocation/assembly module TamB domain-containing protein [Puniceicoccales bacterium]|jgi:hypothetical protein|nr:translocation/assembly module TamB domain-containing protein [Puniceicoccales bacterium]